MALGCDGVSEGLNIARQFTDITLFLRYHMPEGTIISSPNLQQPYIVKNLHILGCNLTQDVDVHLLLRHIS